MKLTTIKSLAAAALCAVGLSSFAAEPEAVQFWEGGPYWATVNLGTSEVQDHLEYGALYTFDDAAKAVTDALGAGWRLPTKEDFDKLVSDEYCISAWDDTRKGYTFTSKSDSSKSIFVPAAGRDDGMGRDGDGSRGYYWSSMENGSSEAWGLRFSANEGASASPIDRTLGIRVSVRAVKDPPLPPTVTVDKVESVDPWDSTKGTITVNYTLGGVDAKLDYKVAFDVTAGGQTASTTNDAAKLTNGAATKAIDTATLFGKEVVDTQAKVKVSLIAVKPIDYSKPIQLWENGPYFAQCNVGANTPEGYGIHTNFNDAAQAVTDALGEGWRLPTKTDFENLLKEANCTKAWTTQGGVNGYLFTSKTDSSKSIFLPAAGYDNGDGLSYDGQRGSYWSSEVTDEDYARNLYFGAFNSPSVTDYGNRDYGYSVRAVRDAK